MDTHLNRDEEKIIKALRENPSLERCVLEGVDKPSKPIPVSF